MTEETGRVLPLPEHARLNPEAPKEVIKALSLIGRTEDVRFSPSNRRLVLAGFLGHTCLLLDVAISHTGRTPQVRITGCMTLRSPSLREPHGLDFIDEDTLVVANRAGFVVVLPVPKGLNSGQTVDVTAIAEIRHAGWLRRINSPASVCLGNRWNGKTELFVCNNYAHIVTRHVVDASNRAHRLQNSVLLSDGLQIPDGIAISPDNTWLAVSNHGTHEVLIYDRRTPLTRKTKPHGVLGGVIYPHGLRFTPDGTRIWVADAGAPMLRYYDAPAGDWCGARQPVASVAVLDETTFQKGRYNPQEGGPKGMDIDASGEIIVTTNEHQPLAFFHAPSLAAIQEN